MIIINDHVNDYVNDDDMLCKKISSNSSWKKKNIRQRRQIFKRFRKFLWKNFILYIYESSKKAIYIIKSVK